MANQIERTNAEKLSYYKKRVNDNKLTQGQRNIAAKRVAELSRQVISRSASTTTGIVVEVNLEPTKNGKHFARTKIKQQ